MSDTDSVTREDRNTPFPTVDPVDKFIFDGIQSKFIELFNAPTAWVTSTDESKTLDRLFPDRNKSVARYPYATLRLTTWELSEERGNNRQMSMRGVPVASSSDGKSYLYAKLLPVNFAVAVVFKSNSFFVIQKFARSWVLGAKTGGLNFQVEYGLTSFDIRVVADTTVNFPQREANPEDVQEYVAEVNFQVFGYISEPELRQAPIIDEVCVTGLLDPRKDVFWSFCSDDPVVPIEPTPPQPVPVVDFTGSPLSGFAPLSVQFTDLSTNSPDSWSWDFTNDGVADSSVQHPLHIYPNPGVYTVKLTAGNSGGFGASVTKLTYITVIAPNKLVTFTDTSAPGVSSWLWNFGDGATSTLQNPTHSYPAGTYTVTLQVTYVVGGDSIVTSTSQSLIVP